MGSVQRFLAAIALVLGAAVVTAQTPAPYWWKLPDQLKYAFPQATSFSDKEGNPPHFNAFVADPKTGVPALAGFVFWTTELEPLERGYDGPIKMLVGMDLTGHLTNVLVVDHHEPYGYFSVDSPQFAAEFRSKSIRDPFRVGSDVDAISRATITITSATRVIKNSARRMARQYLSADELK
jgi:transcriptional regulator of nitric oxide reductase